MTIIENANLTGAETVQAANVHEILGRHLLVDGYDLVLDMARSHDVHLFDSKGNREVLDFFTSFSTVPLGYNHPVFQQEDFREEILRAGANKPANSDLYTVEMAEFVKAFARTVPANLRSHLFFVAGGALAVENTMKAAFDWKHRKNDAAGRGDSKGNQIIHFKEAFHGRSGYTLTVTNTDPTKTQYFPQFDWPRVTNPKLQFPITDENLAQTIKLEKQAIAEIEAAVRDNPDDIAGLLIEPIQGEGGDNHFRIEFMQELRRLADEHEFLLIFDEVQTGFGATGEWWCFENFDVEPDLFAFGKKTQICGIAGSKRLDEVDSVFHVSSRINSTWGGNLVDMIRCRRIVETIEADNLLQQASTVGETLLNGLRELEQRFEGKVTNARGRGLFLAFDLPDGKLRGDCLAGLLDKDMLGLASGVRSVRFRPPLILTEANAQEGLNRLHAVLSELL